jgi:hypothetical protein
MFHLGEEIKLEQTRIEEPQPPRVGLIYQVAKDRKRGVR